MKYIIFLTLWTIMGNLHVTTPLSEVYPCNSNIFCYGPVLQTVQLSHIFNDSKTFVDMKLQHPPSEVLQAYNAMMSDTKQNPTQDDVRKFVNSNFDPPGSELEIWQPTDWHPNPKFISQISDPTLREWAKEIHAIWKQLGRRIKQEVEQHQEMYSIIYVPNPAIVPGGRFREFYYWDSYWIIQGLLLSEMPDTVKGMLENFLLMVERYGFVPNGGRVYYERRSQPPLLIPMVASYLKAHHDPDFLKQNLDTLEREWLFWSANRTTKVRINGKVHRLARYFVDVGDPRPESFREDYLLVQNLSSKAQDDLYAELKSGAESGWDYSTRWFINAADPQDGQENSTLLDLKTSKILPVDLNSFLCMNARLLSDWFRETGNTTKATQYENYANEWAEAIHDAFWDDKDGIWYDYDDDNKSPRRRFYPSNIVPLWAGCYNKSKANEIARKVVQYLRKAKAVHYIGGVPTSLRHSGQQWDFPNAWPPLQHFMVEGLDATGCDEAKALARELAEKWIATNWLAYKESNHSMFEKYDATVSGLPGGGGEYDVQLGFGWTNGVVLDFLNKYEKLTLPVRQSTSAADVKSRAVAGPVVLIGLAISLAALLG